jgi:hypothetical protein
MLGRQSTLFSERASVRSYALPRAEKLRGCGPLAITVLRSRRTDITRQPALIPPVVQEGLEPFRSYARPLPGAGRSVPRHYECARRPHCADDLRRDHPRDAGRTPPCHRLASAGRRVPSAPGTRKECLLFFAGECTSKNCQLIPNARLLKPGRIVCACYAVHNLYKAVRVES